MRFVQIGLAAVVIVSLTFAALSAFGRWKWHGLTQGLMDRLEASRLMPKPARFDALELDGLPPVVQRYFRTVLPEGAPVIAAATVHHTGTFNVGETADNWKPFTSRQRVVTQRPGFVWDGYIHMLPGLSVRVHDAYIVGEGILHPAFLGLFTLMDLRGTGEVAEGELMREGMRVPMTGEVAWLLPPQEGGRKPYWRGTIKALTFEFAQ